MEGLVFLCFLFFFFFFFFRAPQQPHWSLPSIPHWVNPWVPSQEAGADGNGSMNRDLSSRGSWDSRRPRLPATLFGKLSVILYPSILHVPPVRAVRITPGRGRVGRFVFHKTVQRL